MLRHNLLLIFRNFKRFKSTFFINLIGLSSGMACALLIYLWVNDELNVDRFHENDSRLYQVMEHQDQSGGIRTGEGTPDLLAETLLQEMPEVELAAGVTPSSWFGKFALNIEEKKIKAAGQFVGEDFFEIFSFKLIQGTPEQVLHVKNSVVISESLALNIFGTLDDVVGKSLSWELIGHKRESIITGIFKDVPSNSTQQFDFVLTFEEWKELISQVREMNWGNHAVQTFIVLKEGTDAEQFNSKIAGFIKRKVDWSIVTLFIKPYSERYLYADYTNGVQDGGRIDYVKLFSLIALFIILIACINFINLSTAKASTRTKVVGVKKVIGASRKSLIFQYLSESVIITCMALFIALILVEILLPQFNLITAKNLSLQFNTKLLLLLGGTILATGLLAGSYPAIYLSGFNPATILKGKLNVSVGETWARKGLVVMQFVLSIILIVSVIVVYKQIEFIQNQDLGYEKDNIILINQEGEVAENPDTFISQIKQIPGVVNAAISQHKLTGQENGTSGLEWEGKHPDEVVQFELFNVGYGFIETLEMKIKEGRSFSREFGDEYSKIIFNETAIEVMGLEEPIGKVVNLWGSDKQIIGIVKDFHYETFHKKVGPQFFKLADEHETLTVMVRLQAGKEQEVIKSLKGHYKAFNPGFIFEYEFLDQVYAKNYQAEQRVATLSRYFAGLAILISCLGLFGLAAFTAERRIKEIGIRKVLGSNQWSIVSLLTTGFTKIVLVSILIALPVSYLIIKQWLNGFAYHVDLEVWYFGMAGLIALLIAWITVGGQAFRAARANPVKSLSSE